jgi:hypothetical protein
MAPPSKKPRPSSDSRLAVLEVELKGLKNQISSELHTLRKKIDDDAIEVKSTLRDLHDKIDTHVFAQAKDVERLKANSETHFSNYEEMQSQLKSMDGKIWKVSGAFTTITAAIIGGLMKTLK